MNIRDGDGNTCPMMWKSKVAKRITRSTLVMEEGLENGIWIREIWEEICGERVKVVGYSDSKNLEEAVKSLKGVENKRMKIEIAYLKEMLENGEVAEIKLINKNNQIADGLTKKERFKEGLIKYVEGKEEKRG